MCEIWTLGPDEKEVSVLRLNYFWQLNDGILFVWFGFKGLNVCVHILSLICWDMV